MPIESPPRTGPAVSILRAVVVVHPFPSILDGAAVAAIALVAGGSPAAAGVAAVAMTGIQFGIGALNDVLDLERDRLVQPSKPLPVGLLTRRSAELIALAAAAIGLGLSALLGTPELLVAATGLAIGIAYDLWLKRTPLGWLPYAAGLPLLVVFAWLAGSGTVPSSMPTLVVLGFLAGLAIALANGLVDLEADASTRGRGPATWLGRRRALAVLALADAATLLAAWTVLVGGADGHVLMIAVLGSAAVAAGWIGSSRGARRWRERGWEAQAVGIALLGTAWLSAAAG
jgi:4-hydroxybenzoate polyprenyltransferase